MMYAKHKTRCCSLCGEKGHRAVGAKCPVIVQYRIPLIGWNDVLHIAKRLGNPDLYELKQQDEGTKESIQQWFSNVGCHAIPSTACHLVLLNTYFSANENLHYNFTLIEVTILEENGTKLSGWEKVYCPAHQIRECLERHCASQGRK
jgi:hypothetical protein